MQNVRPFIVQNLGKYERQTVGWQPNSVRTKQLNVSAPMSNSFLTCYEPLH